MLRERHSLPDTATTRIAKIAEYYKHLWIQTRLIKSQSNDFMWSNAYFAQAVRVNFYFHMGDDINCNLNHD